MATDATGTPTSPDSIPKYNTAVDAPSGKGFNAAMDQVQVALSARASKPASIASGEVPVWNGSAWVRSSVTNVGPTSLGSGTPDATKYLRGDGSWQVVTTGPKITASLFSGGPPGSPADTDEWIATAVDTGNLSTTNGTVWRFRYNSSSGSTSKWEFIGGTPLTQSETTSGVLINAGTQVGATGYYYRTLMKYTTVRAGDYLVSGFCNMDPNTVGGIYAGAAFGGAVTFGTIVQTYNAGTSAGQDMTVYPIAPVTGIAASTSIGIAVSGANNGTNRYNGSELSVVPIRVA